MSLFFGSAMLVSFVSSYLPMYETELVDGLDRERDLRHVEPRDVL